jgi:hypothetical protein
LNRGIHLSCFSWLRKLMKGNTRFSGNGTPKSRKI